VGQHRRRLLRHHAGPHHGARRDGPRAPAARPGDARAAGRQRDRGLLSRRRHPPVVRGGADQRHRLAAVQGADRRRRVRGRGRDRPRSGAKQRPGPGHLPREPRSRRGGGHGPVHGTDHAQGEGPADDRLDRRTGDRAGAPAVPGQGHRELDQPRGRRGAVREGRPAAPDLRRRRRRRHDRRGQGAGHGRDAPSQARDRRAQLRPPDTKVRRARARPDLRRARVPRGHRRRELHRLGRRDDRRHPRDQGAVPRVQDDPRDLERLVRPALGGTRGPELGLPLPLHQGGARLRDREHRTPRALPLDPGGRAAAGRGPHLLAGPRRPPARSPSTSGWRAISSRGGATVSSTT